MFACKFCNKAFERKVQVSNHERSSNCNPDYKPRTHDPFKAWRESGGSWNRGLTKQTDPRIAAYAIKNADAQRGKTFTVEQRQNLSRLKTEFYKANPEKHPTVRIRNRGISYPEQVALDWFNRSGLEFRHEPRIGSYYPDFVVDRLIVEIDGSYFHNKERDAIRDSRLADLGYIVHRIPSTAAIERSLDTLFSTAFINFG